MGTSTTSRPSREGPWILTIAVVVLLVLGGGLARCDQDRGVVADPEETATSTTEPIDPSASTTTTSEPEPEEPGPPPTGLIEDPGDPIVLVDPERSLPPDHRPSGLVAVPVEWATADDGERRLLRPEVADAAVELFAAAEADGRPLAGVSGFRSFETQVQLHEQSRDGETAADEAPYVAPPGHSEHQTGLALDVVGIEGVCITEPCFAVTPAGHWVAENAHRFGFVIRYPADKESITGYAYEPWHLRYLGVELATELHDAGLTLDEHLGVVR